jgi:hypothetical protein
MMPVHRWIPLVAAGAIVSACSGASFNTSIPAVSPAILRGHAGACAANTCIYVTNNAGQGQHPKDDKVIAFARDAGGNVAPIASIAGDKTHLVYPRAIALDGSRNVYVSNYTPQYKHSNVAVFAPGPNGNVAPQRTIAGSSTELHAPAAIALDGTGNLYALDMYDAASGCSNPTQGCWTINVYAAGADGNAAPLRTIRGPATKLYNAFGLAADGGGNTYVADGYHVNCCVTVYAAGASGNVKPLRTIQGSRTHLAVPVGIALDARGDVYVLNAEGSPTRSVTVYGPGAHGDVKPIRMIVGQKTGLYAAPVGIAVDGSGRLYVLQSGTGNSISVFAPGANGDVAPVRVIAGSKTEMMNPWSIAVH